MAANSSVNIVAPQRCGVCGGESCECNELRTYAAARGRSLAVAGLRRAQSGDYSGALTFFEQARSYGGVPVWLHEAAGFCALGLGDAPAARQWWRAAIQRGPSSRVNDWLSSLAEGDVRVAVSLFNNALSSSQRGDFAQARELISQSVRLLSGFLPAQRLAMILAGAESPASGAHPSIPRTARSYRSRALAGVFVAVVAVGTGLGVHALGVIRGDQPRSRTSQVLAAAAPNHERASSTGSKSVASDVSRLLGLALAADGDSLVGLVSRLEVDTTSWSTSARRRLATLRLRAARHQFSAGIDARGKHANADAARAFATASVLASGTYLEVDALYELALAQERIGEASDAQETARRLLQRFPHSIYANSVIRRMSTGAAKSTVQ